MNNARRLCSATLRTLLYGYFDQQMRVLPITHHPITHHPTAFAAAIWHLHHVLYRSAERRISDRNFCQRRSKNRPPSVHGLMPDFS